MSREELIAQWTALERRIRRKKWEAARRASLDFGLGLLDMVLGVQRWPEQRVTGWLYLGASALLFWLGGNMVQFYVRFRQQEQEVKERRKFYEGEAGGC